MINIREYQKNYTKTEKNKEYDRKNEENKSNEKMKRNILKEMELSIYGNTCHNEIKKKKL